MSEPNDNNRSALQTAASLAHKANAARRIAKGAAMGGVKGAAVAAVQEAWPLLLKIAIGTAIALILIPMLVFAALPHIFFEYDSSETEPVVEMGQKALTVGGVYMSLTEFENIHMDSVITSVASEYENAGTEIGEIEVESSFDEEDLLWMIAINSVAYQQDLNTISAENIRALCVSRLSYSQSVFGIGAEDEQPTLTVSFNKLDPEETMDELEFDDEAKNWARAFHKTLEESDALNTYSDFFEPYVPSYGGDTSYTGSYEHGGSYGNTIDTSGFTSPSTKNNRDLAAYAIQAWENNWGYVWGTCGNVLTQSLFEYKLRQYPDGVGNYKDFIQANWVGRRTTDCVGLVKGYGWLDAGSGEIGYGTNGMPDYTADQMYQAAKNAGADNGPISTIPEVPGLILWKKDHTGVYIGGGYAIEAMGTKYGVVRTEVAGRGWQAWYKIPYITYLD